MTSPLPIDDGDRPGEKWEEEALSPSAIAASLFEEQGEGSEEGRLMTNPPHSVSLGSQGFHTCIILVSAVHT